MKNNCKKLQKMMKKMNYLRM